MNAAAPAARSSAEPINQARRSPGRGSKTSASAKKAASKLVRMGPSYRFSRRCASVFPMRSISRRTVLQITGLALVAAPLYRLGLYVVRQRRRHPKDLPPIPWIGHC